MSAPIPFHRPSIDDIDCEAVTAALRSAWLTAGPRTAEFERAIAEYTGGRYAVGVSSGTAALHLALVALGIGPGDEVITTPLTFTATVNVIHHVGATPVFADVEADTLLIDPEDAARRITPRTRAILPVHLAGQPCRMDALLSQKRRHHIALVQDCAHALEARFRERRLGGLGDVACYSFYPTKNITTAEGGMVVTGNRRLADRVRLCRLHGMSRDAWTRRSPGRYPHWDTLLPGFKYNMSDVQAALGLAQLPRADGWWERRRALAARYDEAIATMAALQPVGARAEVTSAWHLYLVLAPARRRDDILRGMAARGVQLGVHYRAVHLHRFYARTYGFRRGMLPRAEMASARLLSLPLYPGLTDEEQERVIDALREVAA